MFFISAPALGVLEAPPVLAAQRVGNWALPPGCPLCRMSTWALPSSSSLEDNAVFLWEKCKKLFNLCLAFMTSVQEQCQDRAQNSHWLSKTDTYTSSVKLVQQALPPASCQVSQEAHWVPPRESLWQSWMTMSPDSRPTVEFLRAWDTSISSSTQTLKAVVSSM